MSRFWMILGGLVTLFALVSLVVITADALNAGAKRDRYMACVVARAVAQLSDPAGGRCHSPTAAERAAAERTAVAFVVEVECHVSGTPSASCVATAAPASTTTTTTRPSTTTTTTTTRRPGQAAPARSSRADTVAAAPNPFRPAPVLLVTVMPPPIIVAVPDLPPLP